MKKAEECVFGIVGLGLMGGAFAMALRRVFPRAVVYACDKNEENLADACDSGIIDAGFSAVQADSMLGRCDVVFICLYPAATAGFLETHMAFFKSGCLVTDIAGVKSGIVKKAEKVLREDIDFIPGHPMAGSEKEGFSHAGACSFDGRNYILTPLERNRPENLSFLRGLIKSLGFARVVETDPATHDSKIAFTSQLCHVIAAALVDSAEDTSVTEFGGGSFEDLTRIAMINAPMWSGLFTENRDALAKRIDEFAENLEKYRMRIVSADEKVLADDLFSVREKRIRMSVKKRDIPAATEKHPL